MFDYLRFPEACRPIFLSASSIVTPINELHHEVVMVRSLKQSYTRVYVLC